MYNKILSISGIPFGNLATGHWPLATFRDIFFKIFHSKFVSGPEAEPIKGLTHIFGYYIIERKRGHDF